jgi:arylsulfatase A-like enzyme
LYLPLAGLLSCAQPVSCDALPVGPLPAVPLARAPGALPNFLVIIADDVGTPMIEGFSGADDPVSTPAIDALAAQGVRFAFTWSAPSCSPARASLLTGRMAQHTGVGDSLNPTDAAQTGLPLAEATIAELLRDLPMVAYHTAMVGKWHVSTPREGGLDAPGLQGFSPFRGSLGNLGPEHSFDGRDQGYSDWDRVVDGVLARCGCYAPRQVTNDALALVAMLPEPWLIVVSYHAAHQPWSAVPEAYAVGPTPQDDRGRYRELIAVMDAEMGALRAAVHPEVAARTWTVWTGDNGEPEQIGGTGRSKHSLFEGGVRVPMIVAGPGVVDPGRSVGTPVHLVDVTPTLLGLAGVAAPANLDGVDLSPLLDATGAIGREYLFAEAFSPNGFDEPRTYDAVAVRDERFKLIREAGLRDLVFDLIADPAESVDLRDSDLRTWRRLADALP